MFFTIISNTIKSQFICNYNVSLDIKCLLSTKLVPITRAISQPFSLLLPQIYKNKIYIILHSYLYIIDIEKSHLERIELDIHENAIIGGNFTVYGNKVFLFVQDNYIRVINLDSKTIHRLKHECRFLSGGTVYNHKIYFIDISGALIQFDINTSTISELFTPEEDLQEVIVDYANPIVYNDNVIFGSNSGDILLFNLKTNTIKKISIECNEIFHIHRSILVYQNKLFASSDKQMICYDLQNDKLEWFIDINVTNDLQIINQYILVISGNKLFFIKPGGTIDKVLYLSNIALKPLIINSKYLLISDIKGYIYLVNTEKNEYIFTTTNLEFSANPLLCKINNKYHMVTIDKNSELCVFNIGTIKDQ